MKRNLTALLVISVIAFGWASCSASKQLNKNNGLQKRWGLTFIDSVSNEKVMASKGYIDFKVSLKGGAKAGCNQMFFTYQILNNNKIKISQIGSTMMMCPEMEPETAFGKLLPQVNNYEITDSTLLLKIDDRVVIKGKQV